MTEKSGGEQKTNGHRNLVSMPQKEQLIKAWQIFKPKCGLQNELDSAREHAKGGLCICRYEEEDKRNENACPKDV